MTEHERSEYSAASSSLGYFYQCRFALLKALQYLSDGDQFSIGIETLDDVVFEKSGSPLEILQTKHHIENPPNLTNSSVDLWKTLRIWIEGLNNGSIPSDAKFFLITTSACSENSATSYLRIMDRNEEKALEQLNETSLISETKANSTAYDLFNSLDNHKRSRLLKSITILDNSPLIDSLESKLRKAVFIAAGRKNVDLFLQRIEGWWYKRVINHLRDSVVELIPSEEIESELCRIKDQFSIDNLPVDDEIMEATVDASGFQKTVFVEQLRLIGVNERRIFHAITNYYRAFEQRSRWLREDLLLVGELDRYEKHLIEEWDLNFEQMRDEIGDYATEIEKQRVANVLYKWIESGQHRNIRTGVTHPSIARGTYQMLADDLRVGWHLEFQERLKKILSGEGVSL